MNISNRWHGVAISALVTGLIMLCGGCCCTSSGTGGTGNKMMHQEPEVGVNRNVIIDMNQMVGEVETFETKSAIAGDLLTVQFAIRISEKSRETDMVPLQYRIEWFDAMGTEIPANPVQWTPLLVFGRETQTIMGVAPDSRARKFRLHIRGPDDGHC